MIFRIKNSTNLYQVHFCFRYSTKLFVESAETLDYKVIDYNGASFIGTSYAQMNIKDGKRWDTGRAYIEPILNRHNLYVSTNSYVTKVLIDQHTKAVTGVQFSKNKTLFQATARREVILSAGAIASPQILLQSGIGPKQHLDAVGVPVIHNLEVGSKFRDQPGMYGLYFTTNYSDTNVVKSQREKLAEYIKGYGLLTSSGSEALTFVSLEKVIAATCTFFINRLI